MKSHLVEMPPQIPSLLLLLLLLVLLLLLLFVYLFVEEDEQYNNQINTLFRTVHIGTFNTSVQVG